MVTFDLVRLTSCVELHRRSHKSAVASIIHYVVWLRSRSEAQPAI